MRFLLDLDNWQEIRSALVRNKTRTFLTAFGVFWGIFLLMVMLGSGAGLQHGVMRGFAGAATNSVFLWSQRTQKPYAGMSAGRTIQMTTADVQAIRDQVPEAELVLPRNQLGGFRGGVPVVRGRRSGGFSVMGDQPEILRVQSLRLERGRFLDPLDLADARKVAVVGTRVKDVLFGKDEDPIGDAIVVKGVYFQVVGTFRSSRSGEDGDRDAQTIYVPFTTFQRAFNNGEKVGWMAIVSRPDVPASVAEQKILALLRGRHRVAPDDLRAFGSWNMEQEFAKMTGLFTGIRVLVWLVGIGTLAAGVIGVSNIMLIIVKERTKEIGIRRAIGARPSAIVRQIVLESVILTALAGYLGLVAGIAVMTLVGSLLPPGDGTRMFANPDVGVGEALRALAILIAAGVLAGLAPAQRALAVSPTVALRSE